MLRFFASTIWQGIERIVSSGREKAAAGPEDPSAGWWRRSMTKALGFSHKGLELALSLRERYQNHQPLMVPGKADKLLMPEHLLNRGIDLQEYEDPLPLAMVATRDPDSPMSVAAAVRLSPL